MSKTSGKTNSNNMEQLKNRLGSKAKKVQEEIVKENISSDLILQHVNLDFGTDEDTLNFLKDQTIKIQNVTSKAYTELGKVFTETQEKLAKNGYGCFRDWFEAIGFSKDMVYRLIARNSLIVAFCDKQALIEALPITLSYEISKPTCSIELRDKVLNGEIRTMKEFIEARDSLTNSFIESIPTPVEIVGLDDVFTQDFKLLNNNFKDLNKVINEKFESISNDKKEIMIKKIESLNKEIEKMLKNL